MTTELCSMEPERRASPGSVLRFLTDRNMRSLYGPRRMGRDALITDMLYTARENGLSVSLYPDVSGDTVISRERINHVEGRDMVYTVDLCHQTVAAFRDIL